MSQTQTPYSFKLVNASYAGIPLQGFAQGDDAIQIQQNNPLASAIVGADGSGTLNIHADQSGIITMKFLSTSPSNTVLAGFYELVAAGLPAGVVNPLVVTYSGSSGTATYTALAAVEGLPADTQFGVDEAFRTWRFVCTQIVAVPGQVGSGV